MSTNCSCKYVFYFFMGKYKYKFARLPHPSLTVIFRIFLCFFITFATFLNIFVFFMDIKWKLSVFLQWFPHASTAKRWKITSITYFFVRVLEQKHEKTLFQTTKLTTFCRHIKGVSSNIVIFYLLYMHFALICAQIISYKKV